ncbi:hypothetical protein BD410DRAFT_781187 [Rickenella mellea]|uniref:Uncharacterized protein n=1 Tax=Rickenella mellea TaxID=50990 RepID=A0A4Y7QMS0_9AGAM|nr:hypothetical protein BD410DRAFT_781187 [Rickenella mellea]
MAWQIYNLRRQPSTVKSLSEVDRGMPVKVHVGFLGRFPVFLWIILQAYSVQLY